MVTYYNILGVEEKATTAEIKKAYRTLAKKYHPDINPSETAADTFRLVEVAHSCLSKSESRLAYDRLLLFKRTNYSNPTVEQKFYNDVNRSRRNGEQKAERRSRMSYQQYRREEILTESLWALILNSAITLMIGSIFARIIYFQALEWYGPNVKEWGTHTGMYGLSISFFFILIATSYIYEPLVKHLFVGKPKRTTDLSLRKSY